jgi:hypothetical protein
MAGLNPWVLPGAGLLGDQVHYPVDLWQQVVRDAFGVPPRTITNFSGEVAPNNPARPQVSAWPEAPAPAAALAESRSYPAELRFASPRPETNEAVAGRNFAPSPWSLPTPENALEAGLLPVSYNDAIRRPPWWRPPSLGETWLDQSIKGGQGLINFFRSRSGGSSSGGSRRRRPERDLCYERYQAELNECNERKEDMVHEHHYIGCTERARDRWDVCNKNGYPNGPGEPRKWGDGDEEVWFNQGR